MARGDLMYMSRAQLEEACVALNWKVGELEARIAQDASHREELTRFLRLLLEPQSFEHGEDIVLLKIPIRPADLDAARAALSTEREAE